MAMRAGRKVECPRKRGVVAVQVAVLLVVLVGFAALTVDVGVLYNTKADLQRTADAAALAAAARLTEFGGEDPAELARQTALEYVNANPVFGKDVTLDLQSDVTIGRAVYNEETGEYTFTPTDILPEAVRVRVRHTGDSPNGRVPLFFARVFGKDDTEMWASALAIVVPRDIAIVADLSGSHTDDSEMSNYAQIDVNMWDVWQTFPGGTDTLDDDGHIDWANIPWEQSGTPFKITTPLAFVDAGGNVTEEGLVQAAGPAWGLMQKLGFGTETVDENYNPAADAGLIELRYNNDWNHATLTAALFEQGYIQSEVNAIMSNDYDSSGAWDERVAVALGLAYWNSGHPVDPNTEEQPLYMKRDVSGGNGNNWLGSGELEWTATFNGRSVSATKSIFQNYVANYMDETWTKLYHADSRFRYRYGVKTFINYLMERRPANSQTPEFAATPTQPMQAVKDAVAFMGAYIDDLDTDDQLSLEIYGTTARHEVDLTFEYNLVTDRLHEMQANHYDGWTNMGGGIQRAVEELTSVRARGTSKKMIILLTDGIANVDQYGGVGTSWGGEQFARAQAEIAANLGFRIFAVSVGSGANEPFMAELAELANGEHFHAEGSIEEYSAQLSAIFQQLGGKRPVELIR
jgi:hypothetical protein